MPVAVQAGGDGVQAVTAPGGPIGLLGGDAHHRAPGGVAGSPVGPLPGGASPGGGLTQFPVGHGGA